MTVTNVRKDPEALTMTITTELEASMDRAWELWSDPRQLERWWGPPTYPATFLEHDLAPGSTVSYYMTGPDGDQPRGWWKVRSVDAPNSLEFEDGFADGDGNPSADMPTMVIRVDLSNRPDGGTRMTIETRFPSVAAMEQILSMGMEEGMSLAVGQMDDIVRVESRA